jgi:two-component system, cell cycle response regulator
MKILIADDDPVSRTLMRRTLQRFGYEVIVAENGRQAVRILSEQEGPRLALVDWMMPELDGLGLCREIRSRHQDDSYIYILLLTARQNSEDIVIGLEAGADDYITKPCQPAELKARLHTGQRVLSLERKLVEAREDMRFKATRDALTSLWNRGSILARVTNELNRSIRTGPVSLLLCDVDHFKQVNDTYGHLTGDIVLENVANRLSCSVRAYDAVGRYGGEEFLIVLSDCDKANAAVRAEAIREAISAVPITVGNTSIRVSISIGAITCQNWAASMPVERALAQADQALYKAKADGRNRTVFAENVMAEQVA